MAARVAQILGVFNGMVMFFMCFVDLFLLEGNPADWGNLA
jgi:hypothetical protein